MRTDRQKGYHIHLWGGIRLGCIAAVGNSPSAINLSLILSKRLHGGKNFTLVRLVRAVALAEVASLQWLEKAHTGAEMDCSRSVTG